MGSEASYVAETTRSGSGERADHFKFCDAAPVEFISRGDLRDRAEGAGDTWTLSWLDHNPS